MTSLIKINEDSITNHMNNIHKYLEFKLTEYENKKHVGV